MMSKKQWFVLLCLFIIYLLLGACVFFITEAKAEFRRKELEHRERKEIEELLKIHYLPSIKASQEEIFNKLTTYCGKPMRANMTNVEEPMRWDFYHSLFFVITVVSTIGYGNLAPTTMFGRIFMIFYGLVGIPINGIVMVTLGEFFGKKFTKVYNRWKGGKMHDIGGKLGLIGSIALYLIPGFTFFIFIPSVIIMVFEGWDYDVAVYYAFVTLTTIGFGDYVAGVNENGFGDFFFTMYKIFLLVWIIIGLGYLLMVLSFITTGMKSKQMHALEHLLSSNLKRTPDKLRALKGLIHEMVLMRTRPVYKKKSLFVPMYQGGRSMSCPDLSMYDNLDSPTVKRKRTCSECPTGSIQRVQSDTDLDLIDKELTFESLKRKKQTELLMKVSNVLTEYENIGESCIGIEGFSESDILSSEKFSSQWTMKSSKTQLSSSSSRLKRGRACSQATLPYENRYDFNDVTWAGQGAAMKQLELQEKLKHGRARSRTLPVQHDPLIRLSQPNIFTRFRRTFFSRESTKKESKDIEKQDLYMTQGAPQVRRNSTARSYISHTAGGRPSVLSLKERSDVEQLAELLLVLTEESSDKKSRSSSMASSSSTPPRPRRTAIRPMQSRRTSMVPVTPIRCAERRFSLIPDIHLTPPPPYQEDPPKAEPKARRYSLRPGLNLNTTPSPVQRQRMKTNPKDQIIEGQTKL